MDLLTSYSVIYLWNYESFINTLAYFTKRFTDVEYVSRTFYLSGIKQTNRRVWTLNPNLH